ncbi:MAG: arylesterase [Proteobacteria bacterium]|jgi:acyl-CoA thioesterase I|nr:arylesterase [Pseudomonadota bacterium]
MSRFILFIVWLLAGAAVHAAQNVLVFGDSLSAGYGIRSAEAWPSLLGERLRTQKSDYALVNASLSGETTAGGRTRLPTALQQHRPQVVIIALGANDGLRGLSLDAMRSNLKAMIDAAQAARSRVLLVGMEMPPNYGPDYTRKFRAVYGELARDSKVALVPFLLDGFAEKRELFQADGIHPTAAAQPLIVDNVWPTLKPLLRK